MSLKWFFVLSVLLCVILVFGFGLMKPNYHLGYKMACEYQGGVYLGDGFPPFVNTTCAIPITFEEFEQNKKLEGGKK